MELNYNVTGKDRKRLVATISEALAAPSEYLGAPTFAYMVDYFTIDKNGTVSFDDRADSEEIERLIGFLQEKGFNAKTAAESLVISYPRKDISDIALKRLRLLVTSKETLIKKALGTDTLTIEVDNEKISFPWFTGFPQPDKVNAYARFTGKLIGMAKTQKRVNATVNEVDNEKYAFRCFLLRLGFIGAEYKAERKILLSKLAGSSAFKNPTDGGAENE